MTLNDRQHVVEVVGDARRQLAYGFHLLGLPQLGLQAQPIGLGPLPRGGHCQHGGHSQKEMHFILGEGPPMRGMRAQNTKGLALAGNGHGYAADHAMIHQKRGAAKARFGGEVFRRPRVRPR